MSSFLGRDLVKETPGNNVLERRFSFKNFTKWKADKIFSTTFPFMLQATENKKKNNNTLQGLFNGSYRTNLTNMIVLHKI